jgi:hypothetical protein
MITATVINHSNLTLPPYQSLRACMKQYFIITLRYKYVIDQTVVEKDNILVIILTFNKLFICHFTHNPPLHHSQLYSILLLSFCLSLLAAIWPHTEEQPTMVFSHSTLTRIMSKCWNITETRNILHKHKETSTM